MFHMLCCAFVCSLKMYECALVGKISSLRPCSVIVLTSWAVWKNMRKWDGCMIAVYIHAYMHQALLPRRDDMISTLCLCVDYDF